MICLGVQVSVFQVGARKRSWLMQGLQEKQKWVLAQVCATRFFFFGSDLGCLRVAKMPADINKSFFVFGGSVFYAKFRLWP